MTDRDRTWVSPQFRWIAEPRVFACKTSAQSTELVEALESWTITVPVLSRRQASASAALGSLVGADLRAACLKRASLEKDQRRGSERIYHLHGIFRESKSDLILLLSEIRPTDAPLPKYQAMMLNAATLMQGYRQKLTENHNAEEKRRSEIENNPKCSEELKHTMLRVVDLFGITNEPKRPIFSDLNIDLEDVLFVYPLPKSETTRRETVARKVAECGRSSSRNGVYDCIELGADGKRTCAIVRWTERGTSTPAFEIKCALEKRLKRAFAKPRSYDCQPPQPDPVDATTIITQFELPDVIEDLSRENLSDFLPRPLSRAKDNFRERGFEAIAWYQPFHRYEEVAWGIYYNSDKLDLFAAGLAQDLRSTPAHDLAAQLALRLTAAHELFHARVEFAAAWLELSFCRPRYLRYNEHVYTKLRSTPDWLEEALANWTAHDWLRKNISDLQSLGLVTNPDHVFATIQDWLDFSPPGYRDWRLGDSHFAWQRLASELATTFPHPSIAKTLSLPLEGLIRSENLFDLRIEDVPKYFVGRGVLADVFFSTPSRREVIRVLRHFNYQPFPDRGKGSHELWKAPDNRAFPVPSQDPLSVTVFRNLLDHFGWTKKTYMQEIRGLI
jgi:hypothetical protein